MFTCGKIRCSNKIIQNIFDTKFLDLTVDNALSWRNRTDLFLNKLNTACCVLRSVKIFVSFNNDNGLLFSCPLNYDLLNYILGELFP